MLKKIQANENVLDKEQIFCLNNFRYKYMYDVGIQNMQPYYTASRYDL